MKLGLNRWAASFDRHGTYVQSTTVHRYGYGLKLSAVHMAPAVTTPTAAIGQPRPMRAIPPCKGAIPLFGSSRVAIATRYVDWRSKPYTKKRTAYVKFDSVLIGLAFCLDFSYSRRIPHNLQTVIRPFWAIGQLITSSLVRISHGSTTLVRRQKEVVFLRDRHMEKI